MSCCVGRGAVRELCLGCATVRFVFSQDRPGANVVVAFRGAAEVGSEMGVERGKKREHYAGICCQDLN